MQKKAFDRIQQPFMIILENKHAKASPESRNSREILELNEEHVQKTYN
jgi:hypothetical protein